MRYSDDHDLIDINDVNDVVSKRAQPVRVHAIANCFAPQRMRDDGRDGVLEILLKAITEAVALRVEIGNGFVDLEFRSPEEPRTHLRVA